jgi:hypothetical protein
MAPNPNAEVIELAPEPVLSNKPQPTREEEADWSLNHTTFYRGTRSVLLSVFLATIFGVPLAQLTIDLAGNSAGKESDVWEISRQLVPSRAFLDKRPMDLLQVLPTAQTIKAAEKKLEDYSALSRLCLPRVQWVLTELFGMGNKEVDVGRSGWLFYRPDIEYVTGPPFLEPTRLQQRLHEPGIQPDPIQAIVQFRDQLAQRKIDLLVLPIPVKSCVQGDQLSRFVDPTVTLQNPSFAEFKTRLQKKGVHVLDLTPDFMIAKTEQNSGSIYLETDTHWRPEIMDLAARRVAAALDLLPGTNGLSLQTAKKPVANYGDILALLKLPAGQGVYHPQTVIIGTISRAHSFWRSDQGADVLLLGDSFSNIYSLEQMGWGESAGFAEHLSRALGGRPIDCILRNSDGAFATREILSHELLRGNDRLKGKRIVIWEFAARELALGNWKLMDMELGMPEPSRFLSLKPSEEVIVTGVVQAISEVPLPGSIPYKDHIATVELTDLTGSSHLIAGCTEALAYFWSMRDNVWTRAARLRPGDRVKMHLHAWADYAAQYDKFNRSELEDTTLQLQEPTWCDRVE